MSASLRTWLVTALKIFWGGCALLSSLYCLLAYLPYTYFAFIKASPYPLLIWFVQHHVLLFWLSSLASAVAYFTPRQAGFLFAIAVQFGIALWLPFRPVLPSLRNDTSALAWSVAFLLPVILFSAHELVAGTPPAKPPAGETPLLAYSNGIAAAAVVALVFGISMRLRQYHEAQTVSASSSQLELMLWSVASHVLVAVLLLSALNLVRVVAGRTRHPHAWAVGLTLLLAIAGIEMGLARLLANALTFNGWMAHMYAVVLAIALALWLYSAWAPFQTNGGAIAARPRAVLGSLLLVAVLVGAALVVPTNLRNRDWNGVLQRGFTLLVWVGLAALAYRFRPRRAAYSAPALVAILLVSCFAYKALEMTEILWSRALGPTDDVITDSIEQYAAVDTSFEMTRQILGVERTEACGDLCRILRQYSNLRSPKFTTDVELVERLEPTTAERPNVFLFVMDSLRPDYLGAYNPRVDFSPSLDAFARDSVVLHNVYTQYAGTLLSEPAIWAGSMLLHAHYMQPFSKVNSLEKLANADGYRMVVSYDTVLRELLSSSDNMVRLDTDKKIWNQFEVCSTTEELEHTIDSQPGVPVFFFAQPMNIHQFARNGLPIPSSANWRNREGFSNRVAYQVQQADACLGKFFDYLKRRKLYDDSIIIVTSDHGDATGEFGRFSHSTHLYPEVMRVPLLVHLPASMKNGLVWDDHRVSALTDIAPSLYYLLGHRPIRSSPLYGRPLFALTSAELESYHRDELFLASDVRAAYGILGDNGRFLYVTYDSPAQSFLFDLARDPNAEHNIVTSSLKQHYDRDIIEHLRGIADYYGYRPDGSTFLASAR